MTTLDLQDHPSHLRLLPNRAAEFGGDANGANVNDPLRNFLYIKEEEKENEEELICGIEEGSNSKLDLKLNLSPPRQVMTNSTSLSALMSPSSSCLSSEEDAMATWYEDNNLETMTSMILVGCQRCLMYVMLSDKEGKCPKCKSSVLLDFFNDTNDTISSNSKAERKTTRA